MNQLESDPAERKAHNKQEGNYSADFLLAEFERLKDVRSELGQRAFRRFQFYLTITTAVLGAFLVIYQTKKVMIPFYIFDLAAFGLIGYGLITFMNLTFASTFHVKIMRASRRIQDYFVDHDPDILQYLYFTNSNMPRGTSNYRFLRVLSRGFGGGSEKTVIAFMNSALSSYVLISLFHRYLSLKLSTFSLVVLAIITFLFSGFIHAIYVTKIYKYVIKST